MDVVRGFFDYNISEQCVTSGEFEKTARRLLQLGYRTIAINQVIDESSLEPKKKKKKGEPREALDIVPVPIHIKPYDELEDLKILNRLTVAFANQDIMHKITKSVNYKKYHILALLPQSQSAFQYICSNVDADILCFDPESKINYRINRKLYNQLVDKGFHFEILYSPAIVDTTQRKNTIHVSHLYHMFGKSKNVIISSGASKDILIRSPYDIINLGLLFGLSEQQAKLSVSHSGRKVYINAVGRRHGKAVMFTENIVANDNKLPVDAEDDEEMELDQPAPKKCKQ